MMFNGIEFDDWTVGDYGTWSQVCNDCTKSFDHSLLSDCPGEPICGVKGCENIADYYIDFSKEINI